MSAWTARYDASVTADTSIPTTTETVVLTISGVTTPGAGSKVDLSAVAQVTAGTGTTAYTPRWRRGTDATGTLVGEGNPLTVTAGNTVEVTHNAQDTPADSAALSYVLTIQQTGATGNGNCLQAAGTAQV